MVRERYRQTCVPCATSGEDYVIVCATLRISDINLPVIESWMAVAISSHAMPLAMRLTASDSANTVHMLFSLIAFDIFSKRFLHDMPKSSIEYPKDAP